MLKPAVHLEPAQLCRNTDLSGIGFETTNDLADITEVVGQARAAEAIRFGRHVARRRAQCPQHAPQVIVLRHTSLIHP